METTDYFSQYFEKIYEGIASIEPEKLDKAASMIWATHQAKNKIIIVGNGGSASMASHVAIDFTKTAGIRAVNFNESNLITCFANDYGYENWVAKALEYYADMADLAIIISSSGSSQNMINGTKKAKEIGLYAITLSGFLHDNPLRQIGDLNLWVNSKSYNIVEMTHHIWLVAIIDYLIDKYKFAE